jgi:hypothetical protein
MKNETQIIDYIYCLPNQKYKSPIKSNSFDLPIKEMSWENFERLCLKMVQIIDGFSIPECDILGRKGQKQEGIDIYARKETNNYYSYQCKKYQKISISKLEGIFKDFKKGEWFSKTKKFILCISVEFSDTTLQTKFESIKNDFKKQGIEIEKWDSSYFNRVLKDYPKIVYDFFGKEWCREFCGEIIFNKHIKEFENRLDANQVAEYKKELGSFYSHVFNTFDKGLPSLEDNDLKIQDRFVMLDSIKNIQSETHFFNDEDNNEVANIENSFMDLPFGVIQGEYNLEIVKDKKKELKDSTYNRILRSSLDLEVNVNSLIIGEAGYGKSTFLRFLILNLLNNISNSSKPICLKFGQLIPVYIPFAYLTSKLKENRNRSLIEVLNLWFSSHDKQKLFKLIESAFKDERLLIIVDGIDEYTSIEVAEVALDKLNIYKESDNIKLILSSRPYGYKILKDYIPKVTIQKIAPLSTNQQKSIVKKWIQQKNSDKATVLREVEDFINQLSKAPDLKNLAETPLLLNILLVQKLKNLALPRDKFSAYNEITEHLINKHYQKRINSANAEIESSLSELRDYWKDIFSAVAFEFQTKSFDGVLSKIKVNNVVKSYLGDELGYSEEKKIRIANKFTEFGVNNIGILVEKSNTELAFIHRQFQEFLTSNHLSKDDNISEVLKKFSNNPQWEQSIIFLFSHIVSKKQFRNYFNLIIIESKELGYKIALSNKNCPIDLSKKNFEEITYLFKNEQIKSKKNVFLEIILMGVSNPKLNDEYLDFVETYIPNFFPYRDIRITSLENIKNFEYDKVVIDFLFDHLLNGNLIDKLNASKLLQKACINSLVVDRLIEMSYESHNLYSRTYAINGLLNEFVDKKIIQKLINDYDNCPNEDILYLIISAKVFLGTQNDDDLNTLIKINKKIYTYDFKGEMFFVFSNGWGESKILKTKCIEIVKSKSDFNSEISKSAAWMLLFHNFNKDKDLISLVESEIRKESRPFSGHFDGESIIVHVAFYFKENKKITEAVIEKLNKRERDFFSREESHLCLISKDERIKKILIDIIKKSDKIDYWKLYPLLENWANDKEVNTLTNKYFNKKNVDGSIATLIPKILAKEEGISLCEKILFGDNYYKNRALEPLIKFDKDYFEKNLLDKFIDLEIDKYSKTDLFQPFWSALWQLIRNFPNNIKVQKLIDKYNDNWVHFFDALVASKAVDINSIYTILKRSRPLSFEYRKKIINEINNYEKFEFLIEKFEFESDADCKTLLAYNFFKKNDLEISLKKAEELSLASGSVSVHEENTAIGLLGYIYHNKLDDYFNLRKLKNIKFKVKLNGIDSYSSFGVREEFFKYLDLHFEHTYNLFNLESDEEFYWSKREKENIYNSLIRHHSDNFIAKPYILKYIEKNYLEINSHYFINFLLDEYPKEPITNRIVIDIINGLKGSNYYSFSIGLKIGKFFSTNEIIKNLLIKKINQNEVLSLTALLIGWKDEPLLNLYYKKFEENKLNINEEGLIYLLMLSKYTNDEIKSLIERIENTEEDIFHHQPYFINPLLYRINEEIEIKNHIMNSLLETQSDYMTVLYFSILKEINYKSDKLTLWVNEKIESKSSFLTIGYNIIENKYQSLQELIS